MPLRGRGQDNATEPLQLSTFGEWVQLKRRLSRGDEIAVQGVAMRFMRMRGKLSEISADNLDTEDVDIAATVEATEFIMLERAIVAWSYDEPVTPESIRDLDPADVVIIKTKCDELYASRTDDEVRDSLSNGLNSS
jgi:hypothetical protein